MKLVVDQHLVRSDLCKLLALGGDCICGGRKLHINFVCGRSVPSKVVKVNVSKVAVTSGINHITWMLLGWVSNPVSFQGNLSW